MLDNEIFIANNVKTFEYCGVRLNVPNIPVFESGIAQ